MNNHKVFSKKLCIGVFVFLTLCMVIGSFADYQISSALYNPKSLFGLVFVSYGQLPAMLCVSIGGSLLVRTVDQTKKVKLTISVILCVLFNVLAIMGITMDPMLYIENMSLILSVIIAIILIVVSNIMIYKLTYQSDQQLLRKYAILLIATMFLEIIIINVIKIPWGRSRMRMISVQPDAVFQPWWVIGNEMKDVLIAMGVSAQEFKSFPSGHTGNAACAILLGVLPLVSQKLKGKENIMFFGGLAFTILVAISRIIMGAHFLTDVTVGMSITFIIEIILVYFMFKHDSIKE